MGLSPIYQRRSASNPHPEHGIYLYLSDDLEITRPKLLTFETRSELRAELAGGLPITPRRVLIPGSAAEHRTTPIAGRRGAISGARPGYGAHPNGGVNQQGVA